MIPRRLNQDSLKAVLCFPKHQWALALFFFFFLFNSALDVLMFKILILVPCSEGRFYEDVEDRGNC